MQDKSRMFCGIPIVESPIFNLEIEEVGLSADELRVAKALNAYGYAIIEFPDEQLDARIDRVKASLAPEFGIELNQPETIKTGGDKRIQDAWRFNADVKAIACNTMVLELLSQVYGRKAFPFQTLNFPVGTQQPLHTDAVHFSSMPSGYMCGVWLAMEDIELEAGPLRYISGSHKWPMVTNAHIGRRGFGSEEASAQMPFHNAWTTLIEANEAVEEIFLAKRGQALIWTANLLHGGSPQLNDRATRWSQVTHYFFDDCIYYTPAFSDEPLGRLALRSPLDVRTGSERPSSYLAENVGTSTSKEKRRSALKRAFAAVRGSRHSSPSEE